MPFSSWGFHHRLCHWVFPLWFLMAVPKENYWTVRYHGNEKHVPTICAKSLYIILKSMCWSDATNIGSLAVSPPPPHLIWTFIKSLTRQSKGETDMLPFGAVNQVVYHNHRG
jgi:hypothetical protein